MSSPFSDLNEDSLHQINKYLRFFRQKKEACLRTISHEFVDIKNDRLREDMYSKEEMEEFADFLQSAVRVSFEIKCFLDVHYSHDQEHIISHFAQKYQFI